jgi:hypothetical protein
MFAKGHSVTTPKSCGFEVAEVVSAIGEIPAF